MANALEVLPVLQEDLGEVGNLAIFSKAQEQIQILILQQTVTADGPGAPSESINSTLLPTTA